MRECVSTRNSFNSVSGAQSKAITTGTIQLFASASPPLTLRIAHLSDASPESPLHHNRHRDIVVLSNGKHRPVPPSSRGLSTSHRFRQFSPEPRIKVSSTEARSAPRGAYTTTAQFSNIAAQAKRRVTARFANAVACSNTARRVQPVGIHAR